MPRAYPGLINGSALKAVSSSNPQHGRAPNTPAEGCPPQTQSQAMENFQEPWDAGLTLGLAAQDPAYPEAGSTHNQPKAFSLP